MNNRFGAAAPAAGWLVAGAIAALALTGCAKNPFATSLDEYGDRPSAERLRSIDAITLDSNEIEGDLPTERDDVTESQINTLRENPFEGLDTLDISLEEVRAWTISNNLDIQVALVDPTIANQSVTEADAAFEAVFFANLNRNSFDTPTSSTLSGSSVDTTSIDFGVRVPVRTGGNVTVNFPFNRTNTDNSFSTLNPSYTQDASISISQPLLRGAGRRSSTHGIRVASLNEGVSETRTKQEIIRQLAAADRLYWRLYAARKSLDVAQQQYELAMAQLERARRRVDAGDLPEVEVIRAEDGVASRLEDIIVNENLVLTRQRQLKRLMNVEGLGQRTEILLVPGSTPDPVRYGIDADAYVEAAIANRMELLELELLLSIDESTIAFERNQALPLFTLDYTYRVNGLGDSSSSALGVAREGDFADWLVGLRAEIPIGNAGAKSRVRSAILTRLQRLSSVEARELSIEQEVLDAIDTIESGWQRILAARLSSIAAGRTLEAEQRQFDVGRRTSTDVLDAATRLAQAQSSEIAALTDYEIAQIDLAFATGTILGRSRVDWAPTDPSGDDPGGPVIDPDYFTSQ